MLKPTAVTAVTAVAAGLLVSLVPAQGGAQTAPAPPDHEAPPVIEAVRFEGTPGAPCAGDQACAVNDGPATVVIEGTGFRPGDVATLRRWPGDPLPQEDIAMSRDPAVQHGPLVPGRSTFVSDEEIRAAFPLDDPKLGEGTAPAAGGQWSVVVHHAESPHEAVCPDRVVEGRHRGCLEVRNPGPPVISPVSVSIAQGERRGALQLRGDNFNLGSEIDLGDDLIVDVSNVRSRTQINYTLVASPDGGFTAAALGPRDIVVTNPDGSSTRCVECLTVTPGTTLPAPSLAPGGGGEGLVVRGSLPAPADAVRRPMVVDQERRLGIATTSGGDVRLSLYDLDDAAAVATVETPIFQGPDLRGSILDTTRGFLVTLGGLGLPGLAASFCGDAAPANAAGLNPVSAGERSFDYAPRHERHRLVTRFTAPMPCTGPNRSIRFNGLAGTYDAESDRYYVSGAPITEGWRGPQSTNTLLFPSIVDPTWEQRGQPLLVRQVRPQSPGRSAGANTPVVDLKLEWELDLRQAGCGGREVFYGQFRAFVARVGDSLVAYCFDPRPYRRVRTVGEQGYVVRIPLVEENGVARPRTRGVPVPDPLGAPESVSNYEFQRVATLPGPVIPFVDEASERLLLVVDDPVRGSAVWVFDLANLRFEGVITGGVVDQPAGNTSVGFDPTTGRIYVLTSEGILVMPTREGSLEGGRLFPVARNEGHDANGDGDFDDEGESPPATNFAGAPLISVVPRPEGARLFVPLREPGKDPSYLVVDDEVPVTRGTRLRLDPDRLTTQVDEVAGVTEVSALGAGQGSGARFVLTGGLPAFVNSADPTCSVTPPDGRASQNAEVDQITDPQPDWRVVPALTDGRCATELAATSGTRVFGLAATEASAGTATGASARGEGIHSDDLATDADMRRPTGCGASAPDDLHAWGRRYPLGPHNPGLPPVDSVGHPWQEQHDAFNAARDEVWGSDDFRDGRREFMEGDPDDPDDGYAGHCAAFWEGVAVSGVDLRAGSRGARGGGFVVAAAQCTGSGSDAAAPAPAGPLPPAQPLASATRCDDALPAPSASASASAQGFSLPGGGAPVVSVEAVASAVHVARTPEGEVTVVVASASGVRLGPLGIAEVRTVADTRAKGRTGTARAGIERRWCGVALAGVVDTEGCLDPDHPDNAELIDEILDEVNAATLQKLQLSLPDANGEAGDGEATPGGYQAVVTKDPGQRASDLAVNDDGAHTVPGLQAVYYNDSPAGRSRLIVQLAGVHAEARYGVTLLPQFSGFEGSFSAGTSFEGTPATRRVIPGTRRVPSAATIIEGEAFEELFSTSPLPENPVRRFLDFLPDALEDLWRLFVQHPLEFLLLFFVFSLLATPAYLAYRRRTFVGVVAGG